MEGDRLKKERDSVKNYKVPNSDLEVKVVGYPTLTGQFLAQYYFTAIYALTKIFNKVAVTVMSEKLLK